MVDFDFRSSFIELGLRETLRIELQAHSAINFTQFSKDAGNNGAVVVRE